MNERDVCVCVYVRDMAYREFTKTANAKLETL